MAEEKLNLVKLSTRSSAEQGACPPEVMGRERVNASFGRCGLDDVPNGFLAEPFAAHATHLVTFRKIFPRSIPAERSQSFNSIYTHSGMGIVRI